MQFITLVKNVLLSKIFLCLDSVKRMFFFLLKVWVKLIWLFLSYLRVPQINSSPKEKKKKDCSFCFCFAQCPNPRAWREKASKTMKFTKSEVYLYIYIYYIYIYIYIFIIYYIYIYSSQGFLLQPTQWCRVRKSPEQRLLPKFIRYS